MKINFQEIITQIIDFFQKLHSRQLPIFHNKKFKVVSIVVLSLVMLLFLVPLFIDSSDLRAQIERDMSKTFNAELKINSDIEISFLPASIVARDVVLQNYENNGKIYNIFAKSVQMDVSFFDMLLGKINVKEISLYQGVLETYFSLYVPSRNNDFTNELKKLEDHHDNMDISQKKDASRFLSELPIKKLDPAKLGKEIEITFNFTNCSFVSYDKTGNSTLLNNIFSEIHFRNKSLKGHGEFINSNVVNRFSFDANFTSGFLGRDSYLRMTSDIVDLKIDGQFSAKNEGIFHSDFQGTLKAQIFKLKDFYRSYVGSNRAIYEKLKPGTRVIDISGNIISKAGDAEIQDLIIHADVINGKGNVNFNLAEKNPIVDINLEFDDIDLDALWSSGSLAFEKNPREVKKVYYHDDRLETRNLNVVKDAAQNDEMVARKHVNNLDLTSEIKIKTAHYLGGKIQDIDLYLVSSKSDEIMLLPMIFKVPGKGTVRVNGVIYRDDNFPKLIGKIDAKGEDLQAFLNWIKFESQNLKLDHLKDYTLYSDLMLNPNLIKMDNLYLNVNNDESEFLGEITIDDSGKTSKVENKFKVSSFNADNYFLISGQNAYLSPGRLLQKVLWLNEINSDSVFEVEFEKLTYKGEDFYDQAVKLKFGQGYIAIEDLKLKSDTTDLFANIAINISDREPTFNMNVTANSFSYQSLVNNKLLGIEDKNMNVADQFFALPSLEGFKGQIFLDIADLQLDGVAMKNAKLQGMLVDGQMAESKVDFNLHGADFSYTGLLGLKYNKTISGVFHYYDVDLSKLLLTLFKLDKIEGIANIAGKISASASNRQEFINHISSEVKFNVVAPVIKGYGLNDLVNKMFYPHYYKKELTMPENILFNPDSTTLLTSAQGNWKVYHDNTNSLKVDFTGPFLNGLIMGKMGFVKQDIDAIAKIVFLTGDSKKQFPIHIATSLRGRFDNLSQATNLDQVRHRLGLPKMHDNKTKEEASSLPIENVQPQSVVKTSTTQPATTQEQLIEQQMREVMQNPEAYMQKKQNEYDVRQ